MKRLCTLLLFCFLIFHLQAQQWQGASNSTGTITRTGETTVGKLNVGVNTIENKSDISLQARAMIESTHNIYFGIDSDNSATNGSFYWGTNQNKLGSTWSYLMSLKENGKLGLGTTNPAYKIHSIGDVYADGGWFRVSGNRGLFFQTHGGGFYMKDNTWIRTYNNKSFYHNTGIMRTDGTFQVGNGGNRLLVRANGRVGINKTNPAAKLHVDGGTDHYAAYINSGVGKIGLSIKTSGQQTLLHHSNGFNYISGKGTILRNGGTEHMRVHSNGMVGIGTKTPTKKLTVADGRILNSFTTPGIEFKETDKNVTWRNVVSGDKYLVQRNGATELSIDSEGHTKVDRLFIGVNNAPNRPDINLDGQGVIAGPSNLFFVMDSDNSANSSRFEVGKNYTGIGTATGQTYERTFTLHENGFSEVQGVGGMSFLNASGQKQGRIWHNSSGVFGLLNSNEKVAFKTTPDYTRLAVDGTEQLHIGSNGRVGIGTNAPLAKLHVENDGNESSIFVPTVSNQTGIKITSPHGVSYLPHEDGNVYLSGKEVILQSGGNSNHNLHLDHAGRVGIGTDTPLSNLHVKSQLQYSMRVESLPGHNASINLLSGNASNASQMFYTNGQNLNRWVQKVDFTDSSGGRMAFRHFNGQDWIEPLGINTDGTVRIGLQGVDPSLRVLGGICVIPNENVTCPDYVFDDEYDLRSIEELEQFIKENKHLPNVPSASEVDKNGIDYVKMTYGTLEKVEELALYTIDQEKEIKSLKEKLEVQNNEMQELKGLVEKLLDE